MTIGIIGSGAIGAAFARTLARALFQVINANPLPAPFSACSARDKLICNA